MSNIRWVAVLTLASSVVLAPGLSRGDADEDGIRQAVLNYANSAYLVKPQLVDQSVHPKLQKIGYIPNQDGSGYRELWMNFYELKELVAGWNAEGRFDPDTARREVKILDRLDQTAVARLDAEWGIDFFHLAKIEGTWKIMNVIWQTYPPEKASKSD
jgi:hypothetical protein